MAAHLLGLRGQGGGGGGEGGDASVGSQPASIEPGTECTNGGLGGGGGGGGGGVRVATVLKVCYTMSLASPQTLLCHVNLPPHPPYDH